MLKAVSVCVNVCIEVSGGNRPTMTIKNINPMSIDIDWQQISFELANQMRLWLDQSIYQSISWPGLRITRLKQLTLLENKQTLLSYINLNKLTVIICMKNH